MSRVTLTISRELRDEIKALATQNRQTMTSYLQNIIKTELAKDKRISVNTHNAVLTKDGYAHIGDFIFNETDMTIPLQIIAITSNDLTGGTDAVLNDMSRIATSGGYAWKSSIVKGVNNA